MSSNVYLNESTHSKLISLIKTSRDLLATMLGCILAFTAVLIFIIGAIENDYSQHQKQLDQLLAAKKCSDIPSSLSEMCLHRRWNVRDAKEDTTVEDPSPSYREGLKMIAWPCNCQKCSFIEKEYLVNTTWPDHRRLPHDCKCEYTIRGKHSEYVAQYPCDDEWFIRRYCILPIPRGPSLFYYDPMTYSGAIAGKTRLGRMVAHGSRCESGYACNAMLHYSWVDDVFNCP